MILIIIFLFMCVEMITKKINRFYFHISYFILTLLITFRQGQGSDYYNYQYLYESAGQAVTWVELFLISHGEIGYMLLNYLSVQCGFFILFIRSFVFFGDDDGILSFFARNANVV